MNLSMIKSSSAENKSRRLKHVSDFRNWSFPEFYLPRFLLNGGIINVFCSRTCLDLVVDDDAPLVPVVAAAFAFALLELLEPEDTHLLRHVAVLVCLHPVLDDLSSLKEKIEKELMDHFNSGGIYTAQGGNRQLTALTTSIIQQ
jgi:hypothetical protein